MRDLLEYANICMEMLDDANVPYTAPRKWSVNTRAVRRWGQCRKRPTYYCGDEYYIDISSLLLDERSSENDLIDTILHELIHTCPGCMNHGYEWKRWADVVNRKYGLNIKRTKRGEDESAALMKETKKAKANYICVCNKCGTEFYYTRWCSVLASPSTATHSKCGGNLKIKASRMTIAAPQSWWYKNVTTDYKVID